MLLWGGRDVSVQVRMEELDEHIDAIDAASWQIPLESATDRLYLRKLGHEIAPSDHYKHLSQAAEKPDDPPASESTASGKAPLKSAENDSASV